MQENKAEVEIFGDSYVIVGDSSLAEMQNIAHYVSGFMKRLSERNSKLSKTQLAVLAALNMADELNKLKSEYDSMVQMLEPKKKKQKE